MENKGQNPPKLTPEQAKNETELLSPYKLTDSKGQGIGRRIIGRDAPEAIITHDVLGSMAAKLSQSTRNNTVIHATGINTLTLGNWVKTVNISESDQAKDWNWAGFAACYEEISK